jgi:hypothetical protein
MGGIGRSYPRFEEGSNPPAAKPAQGDPAFQTLGAIIGVLCALGFIGWLLTR